MFLRVIWLKCVTVPNKLQPEQKDSLMELHLEEDLCLSHLPVVISAQHHF